MSATIGHNAPPEPTPYERALARIEELMLEASNWLDGSGVNSQAEADGVSKLLSDIRRASNDAEDARKIEAKPFDEGKAEVQSRYKPLMAKADLAADTCKKALAPFLAKVEAEKRAAAEAARREADAKAEAARSAMASADSLDIVARQQAEELAEAAKKAEAAAARAEADKAAGKGGARAVTLRSRWTATLTDRTAASRHFWKHYPEGFDDALKAMAAQAVRDGAREIPGFTITEERIAQ